MEVIKFIQSFSNPFLDYFFSIITHIGGATIGVIFSVILFWCINKQLGYKFLYAIIFSFSLNNVLKGFFNSPRPIGQTGITSNEIKTATGSSFPSGHSQGNATSFTFMMNEFKNKYVWIIGIFMLIMVPLSRLYLGVHWPKDVIAGTIIGILSVFISNKIFDKSFDKSSSLIIYSLIIFLVLGLFLPSNDLNKALGAFIGFVISLKLEKKYIKFNPNGKTLTQIIKCTIGIAGALIIYLLFSKYLKGTYFTILKYFSLTMWITSIAPFIFVKLNLCKKDY